MPLVNDRMTKEDAEKIATPAPRGEYEVEITKVFADESGNVEFVSEKGNSMLKIGMKIVSGPFTNGMNTDEKGLNIGKLVKTYYAIFGTGFMAAFKRAFPSCLNEEGVINTDLCVGLRARAYLKISTHEGNDSNEIGKLLAYKPSDAE